MRVFGISFFVIVTFLGANGGIFHAATTTLVPVTLVVHGADDLDETSNVATGDQAGQLTLLGLDVLLGSVETVLEGVLHDELELLIDLLSGPAQTLRFLMLVI